MRTTPRAITGELLEVLGVKRWSLIASGIFFLFAVHWAATTFQDLIDRAVVGRFEWAPLLWFAPLVIALRVCLLQLDRLRKSFVANVYARRKDCRALIVFLSTHKDREGKYSLASLPMGDITSRTFVDSLGGSNWRMPLRALQFHLSGEAKPALPERARDLNEILVIPSAGAGGSVQQVENFVAYLKSLVPSTVVVDSLNLCAEKRWAGGVRFDNMQELEHAIEDAYGHLRERSFSEREIILDLTSGLVSCSVMGAILGLKAGRRAEYVSTTDFGVWVYDLELGETIE